MVYRRRCCCRRSHRIAVIPRIVRTTRVVESNTRIRGRGSLVEVASSHATTPTPIRRNCSCRSRKTNFLFPFPMSWASSHSNCRNRLFQIATCGCRIRSGLVSRVRVVMVVSYSCSSSMLLLLLSKWHSLSLSSWKSSKSPRGHEGWWRWIPVPRVRVRR